jgi:MFS family permease
VRQESHTAARRTSYSSLLRLREYRALFAADVFSQLGDQLAAVALAVLIYERSQSSLLAALGYATAFVPWVIGGPVLAAIADRLPARRVLVTIDLSRAVLIGLAAVPGIPLMVLGVLLLASAMLAPAFRSSRAGLVPLVLSDDRYPLALSLQEALHQSSQLVGFVAGGALVAAMSARGALALDALSFALSALALRRGLAARPAVLRNEQRTSLLRESVEGMRLVARDPRLRRPLTLAVVGMMYVIVPEAIAPAYATRLGGGAVTVGLIMAAVACGCLVGSVVMARLVRPVTRQRLLRPMAFAGTLPLLATLLDPGLKTCLVLFVLAGAGQCFQVPANTAFAAAVPDQLRARAFGVAMSSLMAGQLVGIVAAGAAAQLVAPQVVVSGAGLVGMLLLTFTATSYELPAASTARLRALRSRSSRSNRSPSSPLPPKLSTAAAHEV